MDRQPAEAGNILLIDDDRELCELVGEFLKEEGYQVESIHRGPEGYETARDGRFDLVVLDIMLPGMNGLDVLRRLREHSAVPVLMLTARDTEVDRIVGLEVGADDYLGKPFNPRELSARIRAILRRSRQTASQAEPPEAVVVGDIRLDAARHRVTVGDTEVRLTAVEFSLLQRLLRETGQVVSRETLTQEVLGRDYRVYDRSIDIHVSRLRKKLGPQADGSARIETIRSVGYLYVAPPKET